MDVLPGHGGSSSGGTYDMKPVKLQPIDVDFTIESNPRPMPDAIEGMSPEVIDGQKVRFELVPTYPLAELAWVYTAGAIKHSPEGWRQGMSYVHCVSKMLRHLYQWLMGKTRHESGMHHLASLAFYAFALMDYERTGAGTDDREDY